MDWDGIAAASIASLGNVAVGDMNKKELQKQRDWTEEMYTKYQSPHAIMQAMLDAGLNPVAAGAALTGSAPNLTPTTAQPFQGGLGSDIVNAYYNAKLANAQKENIEADTNLTKSKTTGQDIQNQWSPEQYRTAIAESIAKAYNMNVNSDFVSEQTRQLIEMFPDQKELLHFKVNEVKETVENLKEQRKLIKATIDEKYSQIGVNGAQKAKLESETAINNWLLENGYDPSSPEGKMIVKLSSDDPKEREEGQKLMDAIVTVQDKQDEAIRENDPVFQTEKQLKEDYDAEVVRLDKLIERNEAELHEYETGRKKDWFGVKTMVLRDEIKTYKSDKQSAYEKYSENLRRLKTNSSTSTNILGVSRSENK